MPAGKMAVQCSHASVQVTLESKQKKVDGWVSQGMKKVVLKVKDKKELIHYQKLAKKAKLKTALITDAARTFFKKPTTTTLAIGPDDEQKIDKITGNLRMV